MVRLLEVASELQQEELDAADAAHQLLHGRRTRGRIAHLAVRGR